eukprot:TRINITY_DN409_c0_g1_i1.p1 TRINITY_DN409_c0_g1~~TRINITY_DN409_c0_g1_i1.p1  ORF type:complete len:467 (-),score=82.65 TRINITY_DN409_c0_g1_i1:223-1623(-)
MDVEKEEEKTKKQQQQQQQQQTQNNNSASPKPVKMNSKEGQNPELLPYLQKFLDLHSFPCPHTNKKTMPHSINVLWKLYQKMTDKPCSLSPSCFRRIWQQYFKKQCVKARHRDGLCQLCEVGHKLETIDETNPHLSETSRQNIRAKKNVVLRHKLSNQEIKEQYQSTLDNLKIGQGVLTMDFKENITLGKGPRELGQSWYTRERRTVFGLQLHKREVDGSISKWHFNVVSECLAHDAVFVKMVLSHLFASELWQSFKIERLAVWCDNAPHFRNKALLAYFLELCKSKDFLEIYFCYFEAYHGKSGVDAMFGTMTSWVNEWIKTRYLNTTEDLLNCFNFFNQFSPNSDKKFFYNLSFSPSLWTEKGQNEISNIKLKEYQYFHFSTKFPENTFQALRYAFKSLRTESGLIELAGLVKDIKEAKIIKQNPKKQPKFSKSLGVVNDSVLTPSDEAYLEKKALLWGIKYKF